MSSRVHPFRNRLVRSVLVVWLFSFSFGLRTLAATIESLTSGPPRLQGVALGPQSYTEVKTKRFAKPKLLWLNLELLRERGIELPPEGVTPEFETRVLDAMAYGVPAQSDPAEAFLDHQKLFYADRYGGTGIGANFGSGRAASSGDLQIKGIGITPLVGETTQFDHAHGRASIEEAMREAVWGEVGNDLPYGANRVFAIIATNTETHWQDGGTNPNALIVREDPVRPAHYMEAGFGKGALSGSDSARTKEAAAHILNVLPVPESFKGAPAAERFKAGIGEYIDRIADQLSTAYVARLYHGATSPSNIEISGKLLDYGTMTAQPGYAKIRILAHIEPAGEIGQFKQRLVGAVSESLRKNLPAELTSALPSASVLAMQFERRYQSTLKKGLLELTGVPSNIAGRLEPTQTGMILSDLIHKLAKYGGSSPLNVDQSMPARLGAFDVKTILRELAQYDPADLNGIRGVLDEHIHGGLKVISELKTQLAGTYSNFMNQVIGEAAKDGVDRNSLRVFVAEKASLLNAEITDLYRPKMMERNHALIARYLTTGDRELIWNEIDETIQKSRRFHRSSDPYLLVLRELPKRDGQKLRYFYDSRSGQYGLYVSEPVVEGAKRLKSAQGAKVKYSTDGWKTTEYAKVSLQGDRIEFRMSFSSDSKTAEYALGSADDQFWWKPESGYFKASIQAQSAQLVRPVSRTPKNCLAPLVELFGRH